MKLEIGSEGSISSRRRNMRFLDYGQDSRPLMHLKNKNA
jgi:hypothetical protein